MTVDGQPAPRDVGSVDSDVADRLDDFRALFTESPQLILLHEGEAISGDIDT